MGGGGGGGKKEKVVAVTVPVLRAGEIRDVCGQIERQAIQEDARGAECGDRSGVAGIAVLIEVFLLASSPKQHDRSVCIRHAYGDGLCPPLLLVKRVAEVGVPVGFDSAVDNDPSTTFAVSLPDTWDAMK